jgi:hypothetical protein
MARKISQGFAKTMNYATAKRLFKKPAKEKEKILDAKEELNQRNIMVDEKRKEEDDREFQSDQKEFFKKTLDEQKKQTILLGKIEDKKDVGGGGLGSVLGGLLGGIGAVFGGKALAGIAGFGSKVFSGLKFLAKGALILQTILSVGSGLAGAADAEKVLGKTNVDNSDRIAAGIGEFLNNFTFGFTNWAAKKLFGEKNLATGLAKTFDYAEEKIKDFMPTMKKWSEKTAEFAKDLWTSVKNTYDFWKKIFDDGIIDKEEWKRIRDGFISLMQKPVDILGNMFDGLKLDLAKWARETGITKIPIVGEAIKKMEAEAGKSIEARTQRSASPTPVAKIQEQAAAQAPSKNSQDRRASLYKDSISQVEVDSIKEASNTSGVDFGFLMAKAARESSFNSDAQAKTSSAGGLFQFIDQTWLQMMKQYGEDFGYKKEADAIKKKGNKFVVEDPKMMDHIIKLKMNPRANAVMAGQFTKNNKLSMEKALGYKVGNTELYLAHFLGAGSAVKFMNKMKNDPNGIPASEKDFAKAAAANKWVFYKEGQPLTYQKVYEKMYQDMNPNFTNSFDMKYNDGKGITRPSIASTPILPPPSENQIKLNPTTPTIPITKQEIKSSTTVLPSVTNEAKPSVEMVPIVPDKITPKTLSVKPEIQKPSTQKTPAPQPQKQAVGASLSINSIPVVDEMGAMNFVGFGMS